MSLRFVRQLRNNTAQSLVLSVKLGVRYLAALRLALRIGTFTKLTITRVGVRFQTIMSRLSDIY